MTKTITAGLVTGHFTTPDLFETRLEATVSWDSIGARPIKEAKTLVDDLKLVVEVLEQWEIEYARNN